MSNTPSNVNRAADLAWLTADASGSRAQSTPPVATRSTPSPGSAHLPPRRSAGGADAGERSERRPLAESFKASENENHIYGLPNELLRQIGEVLVNQPESSSLRAAAATSVRFHGVFSPLPERWVEVHFPGVRNKVKEKLSKVLQDEGKGLECELNSLWVKDAELRFFVKNDVIDYIENTCTEDDAKSIILTHLFRALPSLESRSRLPSTAERLFESYNRLPHDKQEAPLLAFTQLIKYFPKGKTEPSIAGLTRMLLEKEGQKLSVELRRDMICELARITYLVSDNKKQPCPMAKESGRGGVIPTAKESEREF